ncbi:MAG: hypothetical protein LBB41_06280, partial [Prevotellaceae bacterium]|nr:hypothetical protein [Prevotellaceae bacterium]
TTLLRRSHTSVCVGHTRACASVTHERVCRSNTSVCVRRKWAVASNNAEVLWRREKLEDGTAKKDLAYKPVCQKNARKVNAFHCDLSAVDFRQTFCVKTPN